MRAPLFLTPLAAVALLALPGAASAQSPAATPAKSSAMATPAKSTAPMAATTKPAAPAQAVMTVTEEKAGLLKEAKIQPAEAQKAALARVPHGTVQKAEIEKEHSKLIYSYDIVVPGETGVTEVHVDAKTGKVLSTKHEKPETAAAKPATTAAKPATASSTPKPATTAPKSAP